VDLLEALRRDEESVLYRACIGRAREQLRTVFGRSRQQPSALQPKFEGFGRPRTRATRARSHAQNGCSGSAATNRSW